MGTIYLNGYFMPAEQAKIPVMDRGFLFGDGVYEVIPVFGGFCFRLAEHLERLDYSLREARITTSMSHAQWQQIFERLIELHGGGDQSLYLQITRGVCAEREQRFSPDGKPTIFAMSRPRGAARVLPDAVACITLEDIRWLRCDIKTTSLLGNVLMSQMAVEAGADEAILTRDGLVWEGASSNVFVVVGEVLYTAPKGRYILGGITRDLVVELARQNGVDCREQALPLHAVAGADEIWLSSSTRDLTPVTQLNGRPVGRGAPGPMLQSVWGWYRNFRQQLMR